MAEIGVAAGRLGEPAPERVVGRASDRADAARTGPGAVIRNARRIWAIGAVHGEAARLGALHDVLAGRIQDGDCVVYLGDLLGYGPEITGTIDELLRFRGAFLARPPFVHQDDFICLRGQQEEIWQKLLQIQFAVNPLEVIDWALAHGADATIRAYGGGAVSARSAARGGALALTRWAGEMRERMRRCPGHIAMLNGLRRSARTEGGKLLFVNAGIDPGRAFAEQTDGFWWESRGFDSIAGPYAGFRLVIRGLDPIRRGFAATPWSVTVDGGCGFGGPLIGLCLAPSGEILGRIEA